MSTVTVIGAGVAGLASALELAERGANVEVIERGPHLGASSCSWVAGGMLAPWCERENSEERVVTLGRQALDWWARYHPATVRNGTLVVASARDTAELARFADRTSRFERLDAGGVAALEPDLAERFQQGLFFPEEGHLNPREALASLEQALVGLGVTIHYGLSREPTDIPCGQVLDCRGYAARREIADLRGVRGEMLVVRSPEITLSRPVRLLHPRLPVYVVPRGDGLFLIGATMIESSDRAGVSARSAIELLSAAYTLNPAFGEAEIVEIRADVRPAFPDNMPRIVDEGRIVRFNGLFRHGFLLSPAFARMAADAILSRSKEIYDADHRERRRA